MKRRVLVIDHRDSFVFNIVETFEGDGASVEVVRSSISVDDLDGEIASYQPDLVVLSPGPGAPQEAGVMPEFLERHPELPAFGICLGLQVMVHATGGRVGRLEEPMHGRSSVVEHSGDPVFHAVPPRFSAGRYHSLHALRVGEDMRVIARTTGSEEGSVVMAARHRTRPWVGVQFHPESILTPDGPRLLRNVLTEACDRRFQLIAGGAR